MEVSFDCVFQFYQRLEMYMKCEHQIIVPLELESRYKIIFASNEIFHTYKFYYTLNDILQIAFKLFETYDLKKVSNHWCLGNCLYL